MLTGMTAFKAAVLAGLITGLLVAVFHSVFTEPVIDRAIALEEQAAAARGGHEEQPVVSRDIQKGLGLFLGWGLYGALAGVVFAGVFTLAQDKLPGDAPWRRGLALAGLAFLGVALLPFLKHPANPPGVGDADTHSFRVTIQLVFLALSVAGTVGAVALHRALAGRPATPRWIAGWPVALAAFGVYAAAIYLLVPSNPDVVNAPLDMVTTFRALSLGGLALLWAALGLLFGIFSSLLAPRTALPRKGGVLSNQMNAVP
ncbi:MAG: CbtA family protein [Dehalococcoidia bacterium]|nr:CbtA family protein [Dehalococcoidia bacterium]